MISSTALDLPEHRKEVIDACLQQGMFPMLMEHLPASDEEAISASLKLVDEADVYVGVFAHRYGYVPKQNNPNQISIAEMEYNHAVQRKTPRLIFVIDKAHPITLGDLEMGAGSVKLDALKKRLLTENIVNFFKSPADLRAHAINSLSHYRLADPTTFYQVSKIPVPPEPYIVHPYTLLQTQQRVGRQNELNLLTDWVAKRQERIFSAHILNIVAIGGMGKSALTWKWFNDIAPYEMKPLTGRMWWSFYEVDATFEKFVAHALAYVTNHTLDEVQKIPLLEREAQLLATLDREPFLIALDGLERILIAYAQPDAAHLTDDDFDRQTADSTNTYVPPENATQSSPSEHRLRETANPRVGYFLRRLANVRATRILISTRLYPASLQTVTGEPLPNCYALFLQGLTNDDALELWRASGISGARDSLLPLFNHVGNHPLLIQVLASEVARYRHAPGSFEQWQRDHPDFDPFGLPLESVISHVLEFALRGLDNKTRIVMESVAKAPKSTQYKTLAALLVGDDKLYTDPGKLDAALTELEDRGLVGFDKHTNSYFKHPLVSSIIQAVSESDKENQIFSSNKMVFVSYARIDWQEYAGTIVERLEREHICTWVDQHLFEGGEIWLDEINKALDTCDCMVLCITPEALASKWVKMEYRYFYMNGKPIVPIICRPAKLTAELLQIQYLNFPQLDLLVKVLKAKYL